MNNPSKYSNEQTTEKASVVRVSVHSKDNKKTNWNVRMITSYAYFSLREMNERKVIISFPSNCVASDAFRFSMGILYFHSCKQWTRIHDLIIPIKNYISKQSLDLALHWICTSCSMHANAYWTNTRTQSTPIISRDVVFFLNPKERRLN